MPELRRRIAAVRWPSLIDKGLTEATATEEAFVLGCFRIGALGSVAW
jgi:hypothetical protein